MAMDMYLDGLAALRPAGEGPASAGASGCAVDGDVLQEVYVFVFQRARCCYPVAYLGAGRVETVAGQVAKEVDVLFLQALDGHPVDLFVDHEVAQARRRR